MPPCHMPKILRLRFQGAHTTNGDHSFIFNPLVLGGKMAALLCAPASRLPFNRSTLRFAIAQEHKLRK